MTIADLLRWLVALFHSLLIGLLFKGDLTAFLKVLIADFLLGGGKLGDIGEVALLHIPVGALQDGILLHGVNLLEFVHTAEASVWVSLAVGKV